MFSNSPGFTSFAVDDLEAARAFYSETLGLEVTDLEVPGLDIPDRPLRISIQSGHDVMVYPKPDFAPATYTVLTFPVDDIDKAVEQLTGAGIEMARYDGFDQDDRGIARGLGPPIAWFRDPAGNIIAVTQLPSD